MDVDGSRQFEIAGLNPMSSNIYRCPGLVSPVVA